jgi:DNA-binding NarL/FixJ family response regulator
MPASSTVRSEESPRVGDLERTGLPLPEPTPMIARPLLRVFLVEDSPIIRDRLTESLSVPGRIEIVGHADTEQSAVEALSGAEWDALVLDLQLKQGTGLGVLKAIAAARPPGSKVIVLTNYAIPQFRERSVALGADFFFDKSREYYRVRSVLEEMAGERGPKPH